MGGARKAPAITKAVSATMIAIRVRYERLLARASRVMDLESVM